MAKVFVGLSGGVDSSVAALRLLKAGHEVVGVFIKVWHPDFLICDWEKERLDAMRVAAHLGIPFLTCDAEEEYRKFVGEYFVREYITGRTPNPDVMCNRFVKFGAFLRFALSRGADYIATGHYARVEKVHDHFKLMRGLDKNKDQSYFLWGLTSIELSHTLFPVGNSEKETIRQEAKQAGLPTAVKKDSQGICFLGHVDIPEFLSHFVSLEPGAVLDVHGNQIGTHKGAIVYTLGQRHGFTISSPEAASQVYFVVAKDVASNMIVVDKKPPTTAEGGKFYLEETNWTGGQMPERNSLAAMIRYRQEPFPILLKKEGDRIAVLPKVSIDKPAAGQSCVIFEGEECLGGGVIE